MKSNENIMLCLCPIESALVPIDQYLLGDLRVLTGERRWPLCDDPTGEWVAWMCASQSEHFIRHFLHVHYIQK